MNCCEKLEKLVFLERKLQEKSIKSKITQFGLIFVEKLRSELQKEKSFMKREKMLKIHKFQIIYLSKLKSNVIGKNKEKNI